MSQKIILLMFVFLLLSNVSALTNLSDTRIYTTGDILSSGINLTNLVVIMQNYFGNGTNVNSTQFNSSIFTTGTNITIIDRTYYPYSSNPLNFYNSTNNQTIATASGTSGYIARFNGTNTLNNSVIFESGGNVGIQTTNPLAPLHVAGNDGKHIILSEAGSIAYGEIGYGYYAGGASTTWIGTNLNSTSITPAQASTGNSSWYSSFNSQADTYTLNRIPAGGSVATFLTIDSTGKVGIGTTAPTERLDVSGAIRSSGVLLATTANTASMSYEGGVGAYFMSVGPNITTRGTYIFNQRESDAGGMNSPIEIRNDGNILLAQTIGNVGIGTTGPEGILHISKSFSGGLGPVLVIDNPSVSTLSNEAQIAFLVDGGASVAGTANARLRAVNRNAGNGAVSFSIDTWNGVAEASRIYIKEDGNVGIGTTNPQNTLNVIGDINVTGCYKLANGTIIGGVCSSDINLKQDIVNYTVDVNKFMKLNPVNFRWKDSSFGTGIQEGLIAEDVQKIYPERVVDDNGTLKVVYSWNWIFDLMNLVQQQQKQINSLNEQKAQIIYRDGTMPLGFSGNKTRLKDISFLGLSKDYCNDTYKNGILIGGDC